MPLQPRPAPREQGHERGVLLARRGARRPQGVQPAQQRGRRERLGARFHHVRQRLEGLGVAVELRRRDGSSSIQLKVTDVAGNDGTVLSQAYTLDSTAPTTTIASAAFSADTAANASTRPAKLPQSILASSGGCADVPPLGCVIVTRATR